MAFEKIAYVNIGQLVYHFKSKHFGKKKVLIYFVAFQGGGLKNTKFGFFNNFIYLTLNFIPRNQYFTKNC